MKHLDDIRLLVKTLRESKQFHALIIESPPGWAKSTTVERLLTEANESFVSLGSYSTPLALFNALCTSPSKTLVLDDCAGLFNDSKAMAILKAATWPSTGSLGERAVTWASTSERVTQSSVIFAGKLILLTNNMPKGRDMEAFLTRTLHYNVIFTTSEWQQLLREAAQNINYFPDAIRAHEVAEYLIERGKDSNPSAFNLRTLQMAYELATTLPEQWQNLLGKLLPCRSPITLVNELAQSSESVEDQFRQFSHATGLSRRTFFNYRNELRSNEVIGV